VTAVHSRPVRSSGGSDVQVSKRILDCRLHADSRHGGQIPSSTVSRPTISCMECISKEAALCTICGKGQSAGGAGCRPSCASSATVQWFHMSASVDLHSHKKAAEYSSQWFRTGCFKRREQHGAHEAHSNWCCMEVPRWPARWLPQAAVETLVSCCIPGSCNRVAVETLVSCCLFGGV
jgi:hypothetical protein